MKCLGVYREVEYTADSSGFHANIKTNEPGTANENPADVYITAEEPPAQTNPGSGSKGQGGYGGVSSGGYGGKTGFKVK